MRAGWRARGGRSGDGRRSRASLLSRPGVLLGGLLGSLAFVLLMAPGAETADRVQESFPHDRHQGLFPLCTGCHLGPEGGSSPSLYPDPATCGGCHDGVVAPTVEWDGPDTRYSNLIFDHMVHAEATGDLERLSASCLGCHATPGDPPMAVRMARGVECLACHAHEAEDHFVDAECATCHVDVVEARLPPPRLRSLPVPADHRSEGFGGSAHGRSYEEGQDRCSTCHVQDQCAECHLNASDLQAIRALPDESPLGLPALEARYPRPDSHEEPRWMDLHGDLLGPERAGAECSTCHSRQECATCHLALPDAARVLADLSQARAPGAGVRGRAPESHTSPFFVERHGSTAAADGARCATCHEERTFCEGCHEAEAPVGGYHPPRFLARHAADAAAQMTECSTCHDATAFCRACHQELGLGGSGRLTAGYHDGEALWLLRHGQPARQQLETCAACHSQRQCMQCHSQLGAFQISPHGSDFDARRAWKRNAIVCRACHIRDPFGGGS